MSAFKGVLYSTELVCGLVDFDTSELGFSFLIDIYKIWKAIQSSADPKTVGLS